MTGVFALAEVAREGYPDHTAWDPKHPYFDEKTDKEKPVWYMVDVRFTERLPHSPTLALIKTIAGSAKLPDEISYIGSEGFRAIKSMQLINRGRLSVQSVDEAAYSAVVQLGTKGGWDTLAPQKGATKPSTDDARSESTTTPKGKKRKSEVIDEAEAKAPDEKPEVSEGKRRSGRFKGGKS